MADGYPYTTVPNKLREFLKGLPSRAIPPKVTVKYLISIGMKSTSDRTIIPVLKTVKLADDSGVPTDSYKTFRDGSRGPPLLASLIRQAYDGLYKVYEDAHSQNDTNLRNFFKSQSTLGERVINYQVATFKVLCEFGDFHNSATVNADAQSTSATPVSRSQTPSFHIDLHIHLPDSKDPIVHELIFQAISKYVVKGSSQ